VEKRKLSSPLINPYFKAMIDEETLDSEVLSMAIFYNKVKLTN
jgi:hypothetical protein